MMIKASLLSWFAVLYGILFDGRWLSGNMLVLINKDSTVLLIVVALVSRQQQRYIVVERL